MDGLENKRNEMRAGRKSLGQDLAKNFFLDKWSAGLLNRIGLPENFPRDFRDKWSAGGKNRHGYSLVDDIVAGSGLTTKWQK